MKKLFKSGLILMTVVIVFSGCAGSNMVTQTPPAHNITYQSFYDNLSPYGTWIDYPGYGNVWHPTVDGDFRPYLTNGNWNYSNDGWLWSSNYNWGWAPFHYGRWAYDNLYGWLWVPGYEWSPAWVTWGSVDNYYAWAPLMPEVNVGVQYGLWRPVAFYWNLCNRNNIYDRDIYNKVETRDADKTYANRINVINNFRTTRDHNQYYSKGPELKEVEKYNSGKINPVSILDTKKIADGRLDGNNNMHVYRPAINNPQPREFKRVDNNMVNPVRKDEERIVTERKQQSENVNRLPVNKAPASSFPKERIQRNINGMGRKNQMN